MKLKTGDKVTFILFNRETTGIITGFIKRRVLVDAGAGDIMIDRGNILGVCE
jgi:hypothetical protein